uniref:Ig-like domain-containing protein n=1 Tax=Pygocentrus nattereri TaxID=42514 RepID=A0A3B4E1W6_PYGNA
RTHRHAHPIINSNLINITGVTYNHTGWYRCLARNEVSQQRSDRIWLDVICKCGFYNLKNEDLTKSCIFKQIRRMHIFLISLNRFYVSIMLNAFRCFFTCVMSVSVGPEQPQIDATAYSVTEQGYSALERRNISLTCQASSNPPSQYVWFYNNSEIYTGGQLTINTVLRGHAGYYACLAQNTFRNTLSKKTITLTPSVWFFPP